MNCPTARSRHPAIIEHLLKWSVPLIFNFDSIQHLILLRIPYRIKVLVLM